MSEHMLKGHSQSHAATPGSITPAALLVLLAGIERHDPGIEAAADALLRIVVSGERERSAAANPDWEKGRPWTDTLAPPSTDALDVAGLAADPIGTACRSELRRIGHALHAANPDEDIVALSVEIAEMDPSNAGWRAIVLEMVWHGIEGLAA